MLLAFPEAAELFVTALLMFVTALLSQLVALPTVLLSLRLALQGGTAGARPLVLRGCGSTSCGGLGLHSCLTNSPVQRGP